MKTGFDPRKTVKMPPEMKAKILEGKEYAKEFYKNTVKPAMSNGIKYTKNLASDTIDFAIKNPKKAGLFAGAGLLLAGGIAYLVKTVRQNHIMEKHIGRQSEFIEDLKVEISDRQEIIDGLHEAVEAAHSHFQKTKAQ